MSRKPKLVTTCRAALPSVSAQLLDQLVTRPMTPGAIEDVMRGFKKALIERALATEMNHHLGYSPDTAKPSEASNYRNGTRGKTALTGAAALRIALPRDRERCKRGRVSHSGYIAHNAVT